MADNFESLLIDTCTIYERAQTPKNAYGKTAGALTAVATSVACRLSRLARGRESRNETQAAVGAYTIYMMPRSISEANIIEIDSIQYNIIEVSNPSNIDHHLELAVEKVTA